MFILVFVLVVVVNALVVIVFIIVIAVVLYGGGGGGGEGHGEGWVGERGGGGRGWDGRADGDGGRMRVERGRDGQWGGVTQDHPGCPVRCCSGASLSLHFIHIHSHSVSSLLLKRAGLACPSSPGSSAQDHRVYGLQHHDTETAAKINEGPDCCCDPDEELEENECQHEENESDPEENECEHEEHESDHEENGPAVSYATKGRGRALLRSRHDQDKAVLYVQRRYSRAPDYEMQRLQ